MSQRIKENPPSDEVISFGPFRLYTAQRLIEREGVPLHLGGRALDILIVLVEQASEVVSKNDLELDRLIRDVRRNDQDKVLAYVFVAGPEGKYLAHSDLSQLFRPYKPASGIHMSLLPGVQNFKLNPPEGPLTDYASAIYYAL
jgi:hypothetical protein